MERRRLGSGNFEGKVNSWWRCLMKKEALGMKVTASGMRYLLSSLPFNTARDRRRRRIR